MNMKIKRLRLFNNYKRFHDLTINLGDNPRKIVALVGPNGSGKSSILDGLLYKYSSHKTIGRNSNLNNPSYHSRSEDSKITHNDIEIDFALGDFQKMMQSRSKSGLPLENVFSFRSPYRHNSILRVIESKAVSEITKNDYGAGSTVDLDSKMEVNFRRLRVHYSKYLEDKDARPSEAKKFIIGELNKHICSCLDIEIDEIGDIEAGRGSLFFKKKDQNGRIDFNVLSAGEKEVVDIILDLYLRKNEYAESIFLLDEPELHINTAIQRNLVIEIDKIIPDSSQLWIATHSPGFMRALQIDLAEKSQVINFGEVDKIGSSIVELRPMEMSRANWIKVFKTALGDLADLVSPKRIIYCEGKAECNANKLEKGFDAKIYNKIFNTSDNDTLFISSGGNTELDQRSTIAINILGKALKDLEILILKDMDVLPSSSMTLEDREKYLQKNGASHRMLKRKEIENYIYDKEVLKEYCRIRELNFNEIEYDSHFKNIVYQDVKNELNKVKELCSIEENIGKEKLSLDLAGCITAEMDTYKELYSSIFE